MLAASHGYGKFFRLCKWQKRDNNRRAIDVFTMKDGIYIIHTLYFHPEDVEYDDAELIHHYVTYNAGTRTLFLYPEVCDVFCCASHVLQI